MLTVAKNRRSFTGIINHILGQFLIENRFRTQVRNRQVLPPTKEGGGGVAKTNFFSIKIFRWARTKIRDVKIIKEKDPKQGEESANFERVKINSSFLFNV